MIWLLNILKAPDYVLRRCILRNEITLIINICDIKTILFSFFITSSSFSSFSSPLDFHCSLPYPIHSFSTRLFFLFPPLRLLCDVNRRVRLRNRMKISQNIEFRLLVCLALPHTVTSAPFRVKIGEREWKVRRRIWKIHIIIRYSHRRRGMSIERRRWFCCCARAQKSAEHERASQEPMSVGNGKKKTFGESEKIVVKAILTYFFPF